jgi:hypothetical protein
VASAGLVTPPRGGWRRASGAIAAGLAKQEVCIPAEAINLGDDDLSAVSATRYRSKRVTRTLLVKGSTGTAGKEQLSPANAVILRGLCRRDCFFPNTP